VKGVATVRDGAAVRVKSEVEEIIKSVAFVTLTSWMMDVLVELPMISCEGKRWEM
jgi:hypothetical protein